MGLHFERIENDAHRNRSDSDLSDLGDDGDEIARSRGVYGYDEASDSAARKAAREAAAAERAEKSALPAVRPYENQFSCYTIMMIVWGFFTPLQAIHMEE